MSEYRATVVFVTAVLLLAGAPQAQPTLDPEGSQDIVTGQTVLLHSEILASDLQLSIHVPSDYAETEDRYPILVVLDNFFDLAVGLVNTMNRSGYIPDMIVVSVNNPNSNWLIPSPTADGMGGEADVLVRALREELFVAIDSAYRTEPYRILYGSSWAGVFAAYAVLTSPETVNAALAAGPWLVYDGGERYVLSHLADWMAAHNYEHNHLFFTGGAQPEIVPSIEEFSALLAQHAPSGLSWKYDPMPEEDHYSLKLRTPMAGLRDLFAIRRELPDSVINGGREAVLAHIDWVNARFGFDVGLAQGALFSKGWELYSAGEADRALELMRLGVELNPEHASTVYSLGRILQLTGDLEGARENYEKALGLLKPSQATLRSAYEHRLNQVIEQLEAQKK